MVIYPLDSIIRPLNYVPFRKITQLSFMRCWTLRKLNKKRTYTSFCKNHIADFATLNLVLKCILVTLKHFQKGDTNGRKKGLSLRFWNSKTKQIDIVCKKRKNFILTQLILSISSSVTKFLQSFLIHLFHFGLKPLTTLRDQDRISPYNINTISSRQSMGIKKNIN